MKLVKFLPKCLGSLTSPSSSQCGHPWAHTGLHLLRIFYSIWYFGELVLTFESLPSLEVENA